MLANYANPTLDNFRSMWSEVFPNYPLPFNKIGRKLNKDKNVEQLSKNKESTTK